MAVRQYGMMSLAWSLPRLKSMLKVCTRSLIKSWMLSRGCGSSYDDSFKFLYCWWKDDMYSCTFLPMVYWSLQRIF